MAQTTDSDVFPNPSLGIHQSGRVLRRFGTPFRRRLPGLHPELAVQPCQAHEPLLLGACGVPGHPQGGVYKAPGKAQEEGELNDRHHNSK